MNKPIFNEIGSNFFAEERYNTVKTELPEANNVYLDSARSGIRLILEQLKRTEKKALLPAYTCDTVIEPFLNKDYQIEYYDVNTDFSIKKEEFKQKVENWEPTVILVHSYFGKDTIKNLRPYLRALKKKIYIIEDVTQILLQENLDVKTAHFLVGSIRKWCTLPDGAFLKNNTNVRLKIGKIRENTELVKKMQNAFKEKEKYVKEMQEKNKSLYLKLYSEGKSILDNNTEKIFAISDTSRKKLELYNFDFIRKQRQENYNYLYEHLRLKEINKALGKLQKNEVPFYFPILVENTCRDELQKYMAAKRIYCPVIWRKYEKINISGYQCDNLYNSILCIPCDQRYNKEDMQRVIDNITTFFKK